MSLVDATTTVRRGNVFLTVSTNLVDRYVAKGYDVVDEHGNVVKSSEPNDVTSLKLAYEKHVARIKELEAENAKLKRELNKSQKSDEPKAESSVKRSSKK